MTAVDKEDVTLTDTAIPSLDTGLLVGRSELGKEGLVSPPAMVARVAAKPDETGEDLARFTGIFISHFEIRRAVGVAFLFTFP